MKIEAHLKTVQRAQEDAKYYVEHSNLTHYQRVLSQAKWEDFFEKTGVPEVRAAFDSTTSYLANELAAQIVDIMEQSSGTPKEFLQRLDTAETVYHYRLLEVLGKQPDEVDGSWVSKYLSRQELLKALKDQHFDSKFIDLAESASRNYSQEEQMINKLIDLPLGTRVFSFYDAEKVKDKIMPLYRDFADNAKPEEMLGILLNFAQRADDLRDNYPKDAIFNYVVAEAASLLYNDPNIGEGDIAKLREKGVVKPLALWDSEYFNERHAPVNTDEYVQQIKQLVEQEYRHKTLLELKEQLSPQEILSHFLQSGRMSDINSWKYAMAGFEAVTGERLSFREARALNPLPLFSISNTQAYSDRTDARMNADQYRAMEVTVERVEGKDYKYDDGHKAYRINIDCKSMVLESIEKAMSDESLRHPSIRESNFAQEGIWYELSSDAADHEALANRIAKQLTKKLESLNRVAVLPGDTVKINSEEADDYELTNGKLALVTDVDMNGSLKLKGDKTYYPLDLFELRRKHEPQQKSDLSMGR